jgi:hypothetical protein
VTRAKKSRAAKVTNNYYMKSLAEGRFPRYELNVIKEIKELLDQGCGFQEIADELGIDVTQVHKVKRRLKEG